MSNQINHSLEESVSRPAGAVHGRDEITGHRVQMRPQIPAQANHRGEIHSGTELDHKVAQPGGQDIRQNDYFIFSQPPYHPKLETKNLQYHNLTPVTNRGNTQPPDQRQATAHEQMPGMASHQVTRTQTAYPFQLDDRIRDALIEKNIPEQNLIYYVQSCHFWDFEDMASSGLPRVRRGPHLDVEQRQAILDASRQLCTS